MDAEKARLMELRRKVRELQANLADMEQSLRWFDENDKFQKEPIVSSYYEAAANLFRVLQRDITAANKAMEQKSVAHWSDGIRFVD